MSHMTKVKVEIRELQALHLACQRLGFQLKEGSRTYQWFGHFVGDTPLPAGITAADLGKCNHEIRVPDAAYSIGVVQQGDHYILLWDSWHQGYGLARQIGAHGEKLVQAYAVEAVRLQAQRQGYSCYEEPLEDGSVRLHVQVGR